VIQNISEFAVPSAGKIHKKGGNFVMTTEKSKRIRSGISTLITLAIVLVLTTTFIRIQPVLSDTKVNVALAANGGVASASTTYNASFPASSANNGDRKGYIWGNGGGWNDNTISAWPDWLEIDFNGTKTINEIDVFSIQDNFTNPAEPTDTMTFSLYGLTVFDVQYWNGSAWTTVPNGSVTGNNKVWRQFAFANITTAKIRIVVYGEAGNQYSRIAEVEAYEGSGPTATPAPSPTPTPNPNYSFDEMIMPFWSGNTICNEFMLMTSYSGGTPEAPFLFTPTGIISVKNSYLNLNYTQGSDWYYENGKLKLPAGSRITYVNYSELNPPSPTEGHYYHDRQIAVTYTHNGVWNGPVPQYAGSNMPNTLSKLTHGQPVKLVLYGDSISAGYNASGFTGALPYMPSWGLLVVDKLQRTYGSAVTFKNPSVAGTQSSWGVSNVHTLVTSENPDLVIVAFGMNDGTAGVSSVTFKSNIQAIINDVRATNPNAEFILVAPMLANPDSSYAGSQASYKSELQTLTGVGTVLADMTGTHQELLKTKKYGDLTGNNINHPNDFLIRWYAQEAVGVFLTPGPTPTSGPTSTPTPTATPIPGGSTLLSDNFSGDLSKWSNTANASISNGELTVANNELMRSIAGDSSWKDYTYEVDLRITNSVAGLVFRSVDSNNYYMWQFYAGGSTLRPHKKVNGAWTVIKEVSTPIASNVTYHVKIEANGSTIKTWIGGNLVDTLTDTAFSYGKVGFRQAGTNETAVFDNVLVKTLSSTTPAPTPTPTPTPTALPVNVALAANGGTASASTSHSSGNFAPGSVINGDRKGQNWGSNGGWNDDTINTFPDWLQVDFNGNKTITEIDVITVQDDFKNPVEPTINQTMTLYGISAFDVQYWNGTAWVTVPNGSVTGNGYVWRKFTFSAGATSKIRVTINGAKDNQYSRVIELEAWGN
jgi:lysophospholipase L1-like esterase